MGTTSDFNVRDAVDHGTLPHVDLADLHMFTKLRVVSKSMERYSMTVDDFLHFSSIDNELQRPELVMLRESHLLFYHRFLAIPRVAKVKDIPLA